MILRSMVALIALTSMSLVGCSDKKNASDVPAKPATNTSTSNETKQDENQPPQQSEQNKTAQYEPYRAENWAPDPGKPNPDAWQPADSEASKATGSIFKALKNAMKGDTAEKQ